MIPTLVTLYGEREDTQMGVWPWIAKAALRVGKVGVKIGKGIAKAKRAKRAAKSVARAARAVSATSAALTSRKRNTRAVPVTANELEAARVSAGRGAGLPVGALAVAGVLAVLVLSRR